MTFGEPISCERNWPIEIATVVVGILLRDGDAELARAEVVGVEHRRDHVDVLGDQRDVLADAEIVVGREAEEVDAELDRGTA